MSRQVNRALSAETTGTQDTRLLGCRHPFQLAACHGASCWLRDPRKIVKAYQLWLVQGRPLFPSKGPSQDRK